MFDNIGENIKSVAIIFFIINVVFTIIGDFLLCGSIGNLYSVGGIAILLLFVFIAAVGCCISWIISLIICGFGILVQNAELSMFKIEKEYFNEYYDDPNHEDYGNTEENEKE